MAGHPDKKFDMVTTSPNSLIFGYGRTTARPGRFLAAADLEMMRHVKLAHDVRAPL